jgi:glycosyltransferase involved in cell wall biosynthesis
MRKYSRILQSDASDFNRRLHRRSEFRQKRGSAQYENVRYQWGKIAQILSRARASQKASMIGEKTPISVTLSLGSAGHHRSLPEAFGKRGILRLAVRYGRDLEIFEQDGSDLKLVHRFPWYQFGTRVVFGVWRRLPAFAQSSVPMILWSRIVDSIVSRRLVTSDVFHGMSGSFLSSLHRARRLGAAVVIDNSFLHPAGWNREAAVDCKPFGIGAGSAESFIQPVFARMLMRQYEVCDRIIVYSSAAQRSFEPFVYGTKSVVVRPGIDHQYFVPATAPRRQAKFRACYVGRIQAVKGLAYLLAAWKYLALPRAELLLVGRVLDEMNPLLQNCAKAQIKLTGILSADEVAATLQQSDLFIFPSMNEGLPLAVLQAMSAGLPVIACRGSGAEDCITPGENGIVVPGRNADALAEAILLCYRNRKELASMGRAARTRVEHEFTLSHYQDRLVRLYESVAGKTQRNS